jgi:T5SS/PEP-CTERM-associated repeat protein/autotransporter-associated beta strand protein
VAFNVTIGEFENSANTSLTIMSGGTLSVFDGLTIGGEYGGQVFSQGTLTVTGNGSSLVSVGSVFFGGNSGQLNVLNGATASMGAIIMAPNIQSTITVSDAGSILSAGAVDMSAGSTGFVTVSNGGQLLLGSNTILLTETVEFGGGNGTLILNGTSGNRGLLQAGQVDMGSGSGNFTINGGILQAGGNQANFITDFPSGNVTIGSGGAFIDSNGFSVTISDVLTGSGALTKQGAGTLTLNASNTYGGGTVINAGTLVIDAVSALNNGTVTLNAGTLVIDTASAPNIGLVTFNGGTLQLGVSGGLFSQGATINSTGTIDTNGNNVTFSSSINGTGSLTKIGGGTLILFENDSYAGGTTISGGTLQLGFNGSLGNSSANVDIEGGTLNLGSFTATVGNATINGTLTNGILSASGTFTVVGGAINAQLSGGGNLEMNVPGDEIALTGNNSYSGETRISAGTLTVNGFGAQISQTTRFTVADTGTATLNVTNGGVVTTSFDLDVGVLAASNGTVNVSGSGSQLLVGTTTSVFFYVGAGSTGVLNVTNGGNVTTNSIFDIGEEPNGNGTVTVDGGGSLLSVIGGPLDVGFNGTGSLVVSNGGLVTVSVLNDGDGSGGNGTIILDGNSSSRGVLAVNDVFQQNLNNATGSITFNGGILRALGNQPFVGGFAPGNLNIASGGAFIDSNGFNVTIPDVLSGPGDLTKQGSGTLTLSADNLFSGNTNIVAGTLTLGAALALQNSTLNWTIGSGNLNFNGFTSVTFGGLAGNLNLSIAGIALTVGGNGINNVYSAVLSGAGGSLIKTGTGQLTLTSVSNYTGGTLLDAGSIELAQSGLLLPANLTFNGGILAWGHDVSTDISSQGLTFNANGGTLDTGANTVTLANALGGSGGVTKAGTGTLVLTANNTYAGGTTISAGTLQLGNGTANGEVVGDIVDNAALVFDLTSATQTYNGNISGTGALTQNGTGILTLGGNNTYGGNTNVNAGTLQFAAANSAAANSTYVIAGGATLDVNNKSVFIGALSGSGNVNVDLSGASILDAGLDGASTTFSGNFSGLGAFVKNGAGTLTFTGTINDSEIFYVWNGTLQFGDGTTNAAPGLTTISSTGGNLVFDVNATGQSFASDILGGNLTKSGAGTLTLSGNNTYTNTTISSGTLQAGSNSSVANSNVTIASGATFNVNNSTLTLVSLAGAGNVTLGSGGQANVSLVDNNGPTTFFGVISGSGAIVQAGNGTQILAGNNTYSGVTIINSGTLQLGNGVANGNTGASTITDNATLAFDVVGPFQIYPNLISGSGGVNIVLGELIFTANETYTGVTTIESGGALSLGSGGTNGLVAGDIVANGTLGFDTNGTALTYSGNISGTGGLVLNGPSVLTLSGNNTYAGGTTINVGTLQLGSNTALPVNTIVGLETSGTLNVGIFAANLSRLSGDGNVTLGAGGILGMGGNNISSDFNGSISGPGYFVKNGNGSTVQLTANSSPGLGTIINAGTLQLGDGTTNGNLTVGSVDDKGVLDFDVNATGMTFTLSISDVGAVLVAGNGPLTLTGASNYTGGTTISNSTLLLGNASALGNATATVTLNNSTLDLDGLTPTFGTIIVNGGNLVNGTLPAAAINGESGNLTAVLTGNGNLTMQGPGILLLSANNTFNGTTIINGGTLRLAALDALGSTTPSLSLNGGTLDVNGFSLTLNAGFGNGTITNTNTTTSVTLTYNGGDDTSAGTLTNGPNATLSLIKTGAGTLTLTDFNNYNGTTTIDSGGALSISGPDATELGDNAVLVGNVASGTLKVLNGGSFSTNDVTLGGSAGGSGTLLVDGVNSILEIPFGSLTVGGLGTGNLTISNGGGLLSLQNLIVGDQAGATGSALITDGNTVLNFTNTNLYVGNSGNGNLTVANGAQLSIGFMTIGIAAGATGNMTLNDASAQVESLLVGLAGNGSLNITNGSVFTVPFGLTDLGGSSFFGNPTTGNGTIQVSDASSNLETALIYVGDTGVGSMSVVNGGVVNSTGSDSFGRTAYLGNTANSTGTVTVSDTGSTWNTNAVVVGNLGAGSLTVANGGTVNVTQLDNSDVGLYFGLGANSTGVGLITGVDSNLDSSYLDIQSGALVVGGSGTGNLTIANGGYAEVDNSDPNQVGVYVGENGGSNGALLVMGIEPNSGYASELDVFGGLLTIGYSGNGRLTINNGGVVDAEGENSSQIGLMIGQLSTGNGTVLVSDPGSNLNVGDSSDAGALVVGGLGSGNLTVANGGAVVAGGADFFSHGMLIGDGLNSTIVDTVLVTDPNSKLVVANGVLVVGESSPGSLTIANDAAVAANIGVILADTGNSSGTIFLNGTSGNRGVLETPGISGGVGSGGATLTFNGGILMATADETDFITAITVNIASGGAFIDDGGFTVGISNPIGGSGGLTKQGNGTLILTASINYGGGTTISAGTLQFGDGATNDNVTGNIVDNANLAFALNGTAQTFSGIISGTGNLTKTGASILTLSGNNTFTGTTNIASGGTLTLGASNALQGSTLNYTTTGGNFSFGGFSSLALGGLSGNQNLSIAGVTFNVGGNGADTIYSGGISGSGGVLTAFVKNGTGTLTLTGNNTYSGLTNVNAGTLVVSGPGAALSGGSVVTSNSNLLVANGGLVEVESINGPGSITLNGGTLRAAGSNAIFVNEGLSAFTVGSGGGTIDTGGSFGDGGFTIGVFSSLGGSGGLTVAGYGTLDLKMASIYSGDLLIGSDNFGGSTVEIFDPNALQNATLDFGENDNPGTFNIVSPTTVALGGLAGDGQLTLINTQSNQAVAVTVGSNNANTYFDGYITGNGSLTKVGNGTLEIGVDAENDYTGGTTIEAGALLVDNADALGTGGLTMNGGTLQLGVNFDFSSLGINFAANGGMIDTNGNSLTFATALTGTGAFTKGGAGTLTLGGTVASAAVTVSGGTLALGSNNRLASTSNLTLNGGDFTLGTFNQTVGNFTLVSGNLNGTGNLTVNSGGLFALQSGNIFANLTGTGSLNKTGNGLASLSGNDTYTGNTTVSGGTLLLSSNTALGLGVLSLDGGALAFAPGVSTALPGASLNLTSNSGAINIGNSSLTFAANITGNGGLNIIGNGTLTLTGNNTYAGNTTITNGTLLLSGNSALPVNSTVVVDANSTFNLNGQNTTINALSGNGNVTLGAGGNLTVSGNTVTTFTGNISGTGNLTVTGNDSLILAGNNTYTGNTTILGGTLQIGNGTNNGFVPGNITDNGTLVISGNGASQTFSGAIVGTGNLVVSGNGTVILAGNNTFTGNTTIESGTLDISNTTALGNSTTPIMLGSNTSGTLEFTGDSGDLTQNISVTGSGGGTVSNNGTGTLTLTGNLMKNGTVLTFTGGNIQVTGLMTGSSVDSDVDVDGANVTLTNQNTYNGPTYIYAGGAIHNGIVDALPAGTTLVLGESTDNTGGTYDLNGFDQTVAGLNSAGSGTNIITNNGASGANTLTIAGSSSSSFGGVIEDGSSAQTSVTVGGSGSGGSVALGGANTYTGPTLVVSGQLQVNGSLAVGSAVTVDSGATLGGNGSIGGNVTMNTGAMLAPGNGIGTLTVGNLTLSGSTDGSATLKFVLSNSDNASSLLNITGTLAKGGGSDFIFDFEDTGYFNGINIGNPNIYTLVDFNANSGFVVSDFGYTDLGAGLRGNFILGANDLQFAVVPEPATWGLFAGTVMLFFAFPRRRKRR